MILSDLKSYLVRHKRVPIGDLVSHFNAEPDAIRGMLDLFIRKGQVRRMDGGDTCGGCQGCDAHVLEFYDWTGKS